MTGFQPNPASTADGSGQTQSPVSIEEIVRGMGIPVSVLDPVENINNAIESIYRSLQEKGLKAIIFRRSCSTFEAKTFSGDWPQVAAINAERCLGEGCGCNRFCSRTISCPGLQYDAQTGKACILDSACNGCGLCTQLCPQAAISLVNRD